MRTIRQAALALLVALAAACGADGRTASDGGADAPTDAARAGDSNGVPDGVADTAPDPAPDADADADDAAAAVDAAPDAAPDTAPDAGAVTWPTPDCPPVVGAATLAEKARLLDDLVRRQHLDDGLIRNLTVAADGRVVARHHVPSSGLWTAIYLASQSLRYAVTRDPQARENAAVAVRGLHDLTLVTGSHGLYGRAYARPDVVYANDVAGAPTWVASPAPGYEGWWYNDDVSKDTMDGIVFGYAVALEHLDDAETVALVREDLLAFVRRFVDDGLNIIDHDGEVTLHGRIYASALDDYPGFNALLASSWIKSAIDAGADDLTHFYDDCLMRLGDTTDCPAFEFVDLGPYIDAIEDLLFVYRPDCDTSFDNIDMVFQAIYPLLRREANPALRDRLRAVLEVGIWQPPDPTVAPPVHRSTHSLYTFLYGALAHPTPADEVFLAAHRDAVCTLHELPLDRRDRDVAPQGYEAVCTNRVGKPNAAEPLPLSDRAYDNYLWRLDPYEIDAHTAQPGRVFSPEDYLLAYWLGRYHGFLTAAD